MLTETTCTKTADGGHEASRSVLPDGLPSARQPSLSSQITPPSNRSQTTVNANKLDSEQKSYPTTLQEPLLEHPRGLSSLAVNLK